MESKLDSTTVSTADESTTSVETDKISGESQSSRQNKITNDVNLDEGKEPLSEARETLLSGSTANSNSVTVSVRSSISVPT